MEEKNRKTLDQINKELRKIWDSQSFDSQQIRAGEDPYPSTENSLLFCSQYYCQTPCTFEFTEFLRSF